MDYKVERWEIWFVFQFYAMHDVKYYLACHEYVFHERNINKRWIKLSYTFPKNMQNLVFWSRPAFVIAYKQNEEILFVLFVGPDCCVLSENVNCKILCTSENFSLYRND